MSAAKNNVRAQLEELFLAVLRAERLRRRCGFLRKIGGLGPEHLRELDAHDEWVKVHLRLIQGDGTSRLPGLSPTDDDLAAARLAAEQRHLEDRRAGRCKCHLHSAPALVRVAAAAA